MKKNLKVVSFIILAMTFTHFLNGQTSIPTKSSPPSDAASGYTYDFEKARNLIIERITDPKTSNADAQVFLNQPDFPVLGKGKKIDAEYTDKLRIWMEKNPNLIINTLKSRTDIVTQY